MTLRRKLLLLAATIGLLATAVEYGLMSTTSSQKLAGDGTIIVESATGDILVWGE